MTFTNVAIVLAVVAGCFFGVALVVTRKINKLQRFLERILTGSALENSENAAEFRREQRSSNERMIGILRSDIKNMIGKATSELIHAVPERAKDEESVARRQGGLVALPAATIVSSTAEDLTSSESARLDAVSNVGEEALALLQRDGRTSAIASIEGFAHWVKAKWPGFEVEPLIAREGSWLLTVLSESRSNRGVVLPALDTVVGAGAISDWFECHGYDGTRVLQRHHVRILAEAMREGNGQSWRVAKKGLISREIGGGV